MQVEKRDYYEILGLQRGCEGTEIKKAYRKLAMACHPDHHPGDHTAESRFKELAEAYQVLSDPQKRELYDQYGHAGPRGSGFGGGFSGIEDILSQFAEFFGGGFGGMPGAQPAPRNTCGGRGQVAHAQGIFMIATTCPTCRGRGRVVKDK